MRGYRDVAIPMARGPVAEPSTWASGAELKPHLHTQSVDLAWLLARPDSPIRALQRVVVDTASQFEYA
jgi:hypothetical protein